VQKVQIGYGSYSEDFIAPGDRRRFTGFAARNDISLVNVWTPEHSAVCSVLTLGGDISRWKELKRRESPVVLDIVDAYLDEPMFSVRRHLRGIYKSVKRDFKIPTLSYSKLLREVIANVDAIVCASEEQRDFLSTFNPNAHAIVDCFDEIIIDHPLTPTSGETIRLLWEGFPENLCHFTVLADSLTQLAKSNKVELTVVTAIGEGGRRRRALEDFAVMTKNWGVEVQVRPWSVENLKHESAVATVGVIPIDAKNRMAWLKSENKMLGFWALGIPVMASATPSYSRAGEVSQAVNSAVHNSDWLSALNVMCSTQSLRQQNAEAGYALAQKICRGHAVDQQWKNVLQSIDINIDVGDKSQ
jgi:hypothetical protein